jgi:16S rRNA (uracil1498-N3)-methyltransferase
LRQFLLPDEVSAQRAGDVRTVTIIGGDFHYLINVRRLRVGDSFPGVTKTGEMYSCATLRVEHDCAIIECRAVDVGSAAATEFNGTDSAELILCQCVPKLPKMDLIVRMASELGVSRMIPVISRYSAAGKSDMDMIEARRTRWEKIAREALQQSGRKKLLSIERPCILSDLPDLGVSADTGALPQSEAEISAGVFGDETGVKAVSLHQLLGLRQVRRIFTLVGPEGGLSDSEREVLVSKGFAPVYLGETVLRTETAAVALAAIVRFLLLEKDEWKPKKA